MNLEMPEGVTLVEQETKGVFYIMHDGLKAGQIAEWDKEAWQGGGTCWESRGVGHCLVGEYDDPQTALNESLKDSGIIKVHLENPGHKPGRLLDCAACEDKCHCGPAVEAGEETKCVWPGHDYDEEG